jgi:hypothetical protein
MSLFDFTLPPEVKAEAAQGKDQGLQALCQS